MSRPSASTRPGPQLAERARRAKPDPQHGLASIQRDLSHGWVVWARCASMNVCIQPRYAERVRCAALSTVARSTDRSRLAGPPPGDWRRVHDVHGVPSGHDGEELRQPRIDIAAEKLRLAAARPDIAVRQQLGAGRLPVGQRRPLIGVVRDGAAGIDQPDVDPGGPGAEAGDYGRGVDGGQPASKWAG